MPDLLPAGVLQVKIFNLPCPPPPSSNHLLLPTTSTVSQPTSSLQPKGFITDCIFHNRFYFGTSGLEGVAPFSLITAHNPLINQTQPQLSLNFVSKTPVCSQVDRGGREISGSPLFSTFQFLPAHFWDFSHNFSHKPFSRPTSTPTTTITNPLRRRHRGID